MTETSSDTTDIAERACDFLQGVLERMGIQADIDVNEGDDKIVLEIQTADPEVVIGRKGQVVDALQHLVSKVVYRERAGEKGKPIVVDAGGYREKHVQRLESLAQRMGEKALSTQAIVELSPMSAHDRRIVHMAIAAIPGLTSRSEGEGDDRHILVVPEALAAK
ncbi:MAG: KH domain-containing protein [Kofleriaceae bacterium]|nr:KH domain-containing protein [Kofleriaceae bacterium]MCL4227102.1 KH domain-containing protein [Myxococcales bacterium]